MNNEAKILEGLKRDVDEISGKAYETLKFAESIKSELFGDTQQAENVKTPSNCIKEILDNINLTITETFETLADIQERIG